MRSMFVLIMMSVALFTACSSSEKKAAELLETAVFEEKQHNLDHASKLYDEIIKKFPSSPAAKEAASHLNTLKNSKP